MLKIPRGKFIPSGGQQFKLAYIRSAGQWEHYEWFLKRHTTGPGTFEAIEQTRSRVSEYCVGRTELGLDKVFFYRREYERELVQDGRVRIIDETPRREPVLISDNKGIDSDKASIVPFYYTVASDGQFGMLPGRQYHLLVYDSAAFLFPMLSQKKVAVGESWEKKTVVRVGLRGLPHMFEIKMTATLSGIKQIRKDIDARVCAQIDYQYSGSFDSDEPGSPIAHGAVPIKVRHEVTGRGTVLWWLKRGRPLWRDDHLEVTTTRQVPEVKRSSEGERPESIIRFKTQVEHHTVHVRARLLDYGERMKPGKLRKTLARGSRSRRGRRGPDL